MLRGRMFRATALALAILCGLGSTAARAATTAEIALAKQHFDTGSAAFAAHRYRPAVSEFLESYRLSRRLDLLFNIGLCYRNLNDPGRATEYYRRYLIALPDAPERVGLERELAAMASHVGRIAVTAAPGSAITLDDIPLGTAPLDDPYVTAGEHTLRAAPSAGAGAPGTVQVVVISGQRLLVDLTSPWLTAARGQESPRRPWLWPVVGVGAAVVVAAIITSVVLTTGGTDFRGKARASCTAPGCDLVDLTGGGK